VQTEQLPRIFGNICVKASPGTGQLLDEQKNTIEAFSNWRFALSAHPVKFMSLARKSRSYHETLPVATEAQSNYGGRRLEASPT